MRFKNYLKPYLHLCALFGFASFLLLSIAILSEHKKEVYLWCFVCHTSCILNISVYHRVSRSLRHCVRLSVTLKREVCEGSQAGAGGAGLAGGNVNTCVYSFSLFFCLQFCLTASLRRPGKPEFTTCFRVSVYGFSDAFYSIRAVVKSCIQYLHSDFSIWTLKSHLKINELHWMQTIKVVCTQIKSFSLAQWL